MLPLRWAKSDLRCGVFTTPDVSYVPLLGLLQQSAAPGGFNSGKVWSRGCACWKAEISVCAALVASASREGASVPRASSSFCWLAGNLGLSWARRGITLITAFIFTGQSLCVCLRVQICPFYEVVRHAG